MFRGAFCSGFLCQKRPLLAGRPTSLREAIPGEGGPGCPPRGEPDAQKPPITDRKVHRLASRWAAPASLAGRPRGDEGLRTPSSLEAGCAHSSQRSVAIGHGPGAGCTYPGGVYASLPWWCICLPICLPTYPPRVHSVQHPAELHPGTLHSSVHGVAEQARGALV